MQSPSHFAGTERVRGVHESSGAWGRLLHVPGHSKRARLARAHSRRHPGPERLSRPAVRRIHVEEYPIATSPAEQLATMIVSLTDRTGKSLEQWSAVVGKSGKAKHGEIVAWLRAALRPIYDALMTKILAFGTDIEQAPKKGYMSLRRQTQFATLHPSTKTRFDLGLKLKGIEPTARLEKAGSWNAMVSHRVRLESVKGVNEEVIRWLRAAYDAAE